ncbi:type III polyketide synthase [Streptomyces ipomoeae]|uniref:type III polyketide synthase n=1 Tax=Streptomyces ipomoeae TaxID=103232 RepID=UPI0029A13CAA|nr:type III polyketide synthase [Streptomyces ipomoeae]MDX2819756.1 type III polyketide synthase [Streptomyces ipomoeae]MDX2874991.1 type III polyketide synthase [Streptomyces ipomoeae]
MGRTTGQHDRRPTGPAPRVTAAEVVVPTHRYEQQQIVAEVARETMRNLTHMGGTLRKISGNSGVTTRHLSLPLETYRRLDGFTEANSAWLEQALDLGERALAGALRAAGVAPEDVDAVVSTTVTGVAVPSLEARLAQRVGLRPDVTRVPLFGHGCAGGAAGLARLHDHLRAYPDRVGVLLSVELCSLTHQLSDTSMASIVPGSLFGDAAAAVVAVGGHRAEGITGPELVDACSTLYPDSEDVLGWQIGSYGFRVVLSRDLPEITERQLPKDVSGFLGRHGLTPELVRTWILHPGGPKVIDAVERAFRLPPETLAPSRHSLASRGNLSSVSVLDILRTAMETPPPAGSPGLVTAMGPGFATEQVLLRW